MSPGLSVMTSAPLWRIVHRPSRIVTVKVEGYFISLFTSGVVVVPSCAVIVHR